jgi:hemerythrin-like domain-containing protein
VSEDIFKRLRDDHRRVLGELDDLERTTGARSATGAGVIAAPAALEQARDLVALLERQFETHMAAEDEVLFPALARDLTDGPALVGPLYEEHDELKLMLAALAKTLRQPPGVARDEQVVVQIRDLTDLLRIHIRKEETLVFGVAERVLEPHQRAELAARRLPETGRSRPGDSNSQPKGPPV